MIRLTKQTDYGLVILADMAKDETAGLFQSSTVSERTQIPEPMVKKTLKALARAGILESTRGAKGGYQLARASEEITAAEIIVALEGPISLTECTDESEVVCAFEEKCAISKPLREINQAIGSVLESISLEQLSRPAIDKIEA